MLRKSPGRVRTEEKGFMLVELLVVVLIIGVLAAIAIPAFLGQRDKAHDASAKSSVRNAALAAQAFATETQSYAGLDKAALPKIEPTLADGQGSTLAVSVGGGGTSYSITITSKSNNTFSIARDATTGTTSRTCTAKNSGACPNSGTW
jgi:type IV pilus assembly protein PilA